MSRNASARGVLARLAAFQAASQKRMAQAGPVGPFGRWVTTSTGV